MEKTEDYIKKVANAAFASLLVADDLKRATSTAFLIAPSPETRRSALAASDADYAMSLAFEAADACAKAARNLAAKKIGFAEFKKVIRDNYGD